MVDSGKKFKKDIEEFRLFDDTFMSAVFDGKIEETELLLKVILERDDITVISAKAQVYMANLNMHEIRLDIYAIDSQGNEHDIEVQRDAYKAPPERARFHASMMDSRMLEKGDDYKAMKKRYVIFIMEEDKYGADRPMYHIKNTIDEFHHAPFGDGGFIIYVNGQYRNLETPIGRLMHDFSCSDERKMVTPLLAERVHYLKRTEGGYEEMCKIMENRITEEKIELAKDAIKDGELTLEQIAKILKLPLAIIENLANPKTA